ncbi:MAG: DNA methyltransferase [Spirochaetaceae bacterium]|nr:DNA methyltransferase [Spirochaetaceae bacterium]
MARLDDLVARVEDQQLRQEIESELKPLRDRKQFGLVFEPHEPEFVVTPATSLRPGRRVLLRSDPEGGVWTVVSPPSSQGTVELHRRGETTERPRRDLLALQNLGEEAYPILEHTGSTGTGGGAAHTVINGENFHALTALQFALAGSVDLIYIDPPFNTGARSWRYNNRFVDSNDGYRHSKWLSFMEKRLQLARRLLTASGVLVVMIDEHESHRLGVLLQDLFPDAAHQTITIMTNPAGIATVGRFSRVDEYAHVVFFGDSGADARPDDLLTPLYDEGHLLAAGGKSPWQSLLRRGSSWAAEKRPNLVYPIAVDPSSGRVVAVGETARERDSYEFDPDLTIEGYPVAWPIRNDGTLGIWRIGRELLQDLMSQGMVRSGMYDGKRRTYPVSYLSETQRAQIESGLLEVVPTSGEELDPPVPLDLRYAHPPDRRVFTMWHRSRHAAGNHGSEVLRGLLGIRQAFDYPKSLYAVRDMLDALTANKPDALILDFFAGSGTTLHATCLLNAQDGGRRRTVLVTNNELSDRADRDARDLGNLPGDPEYESRGVFEAVTRPRIEAALSGQRPDGEPVAGFRYPPGYGLDVAPADGFPSERVEFFSLDHLDPEEVDAASAGRLEPLLWLHAGAIGSPPQDGLPWSIPECAGCAVLFDAGKLRSFAAEVKKRPEITHVWIHNDGLDVDRPVVSGMFQSVAVGLLPDDYRSRIERVLSRTRS